MKPSPNAPPPVEAQLAHAIALVNAGRSAEARTLCERLDALGPPRHPAVLQLLAVICWQEHDPHAAWQYAQASLALRPDHPPTLVVASDAARALGRHEPARGLLERLVQLAPQHADAWFALSLVRQDLHDLAGAAQALREVLLRDPQRADAAVNLGIVLQDSGELDAAMRAYGRAYRLRDETFGRIANALANAPTGSLWLDLHALRDALRNAPA